MGIDCSESATECTAARVTGRALWHSSLAQFRGSDDTLPGDLDSERRRRTVISARATDAGGEEDHGQAERDRDQRTGRIVRQRLA